jgi:WXG100 family type VII secretion target
MAVLKADTEHMSASAQKVAAAVERVRAEVRSLRVDLESLNGSWQGLAATNFQAVVVQWSGTQTQVEGSLDAIGLALQQASSAYQEIESNNARLFQ